jgi:hypothetical protein
MIAEYKLYNTCLDIMETALPKYYVIPKYTFTYYRNNGSLTTYNQQYILQKKNN